MKNANGTGTIYKLNRPLRKPYVAKAPATYDGISASPKQKIIGYFATKKEAMIALGDYLKTPYSVESVSVNDCIDKILEHTNMVDKSRKNLKTVYNKWFKRLYNVRMTDLKISIVQSVLDDVTASHSFSLWLAKMIANYAFEFEYIQRPFADFLICKKPGSVREKIIYSKIEILGLHKHDLTESNLTNLISTGNRASGEITDYAEFDDAMLCYLYTGCRLEELLQLKKSGVVLSDIPHIITGEKTEAGKNRIIPLHPRIMSIVNAWMNIEGDYLFPPSIRRYFSAAGSRDFHLKKRFKQKHCLHETRHTFRTELDRVESNVTNINKLMGHTGGHIGQKVYTHKTIQELYDTICKVSFQITSDELNLDC